MNRYITNLWSAIVINHRWYGEISLRFSMLWRKQRSQCYVDMVHHRSLCLCQLGLLVIVSTKEKEAEEVKVWKIQWSRQKVVTYLTKELYSVQIPLRIAHLSYPHHHTHPSPSSQSHPAPRRPALLFIFMYRTSPLLLRYSLSIQYFTCKLQTLLNSSI